jgi:hypothetical protein
MAAFFDFRRPYRHDVRPYSRKSRVIQVPYGTLQCGCLNLVEFVACTSKKDGCGRRLACVLMVLRIG